MSTKSVKVTTIKNHEAIWKSSKLSFPIWFAHVPLNPGFCFVTALKWLDFFSKRFLVCFDVTMARSLVDSLYGRLEGVLVRACSACGVWNWWIQMGQCMQSFNRWVVVSIGPFQNEIHFLFVDIPDISVKYWGCLAKPTENGFCYWIYKNGTNPQGRTLMNLERSTDQFTW